ncbi:hypothetical protein LCGC14_2453870 [marine sediment metagenome]|uniref:Uncharacterized protein n=1 Tax=marine sediment metagenome TaxID=412755 RepID=A0A0F9C2W0_9ZZZZ
MAKTFTAQSVGINHDWDFDVDDNGNITALNIQSEVNYGEMGRVERFDIWASLNPAQKTKIQQGYDLAKQLFNNYFLGA